MDDLMFKQKYRKYKNRYLAAKRLRRQRGGDPPPVPSPNKDALDKFMDYRNVVPHRIILDNQVKYIEKLPHDINVSLFDPITFGDKPNLTQFAQDVGLIETTLNNLLSTYHEKNSTILYHTIAHAFNTCYAAKVLWENWVAPKIQDKNKEQIWKQICLLAAFGHDAWHDGSTNVAGNPYQWFCGKCSTHISCKIWEEECKKTPDKQPHMEGVQAAEAWDKVQYDDIFKEDTEKRKDMFIKAIEHTWMFNHGKDMEQIPAVPEVINENNIGKNMEYIVHAADLIGQALPLKTSLKLGDDIDKELLEPEKRSTRTDADFKNSQIWFLVFFRYIEFWLRLIRYYDPNFETPLSRELTKNILDNSKYYLAQ